jgi:drug/metabolite transporter (DMT)-like permease
VHQSQRPLFALFLRLCSTLVFAAMFALIKLGGERGIAVPEIMFWRQALTPLAIGGWLWWGGGLQRLRTARMGAHGLRALVGSTNMAMTFTATTLLPLAVTITLGFTTPLFAVLLSAFWFRQHVGPWRWLSVLLGFAGVLAIAQPGGGHVNLLGAGLALAGGCVVAVINYQIRDLGRTEEPIRTVFWFGLFGTAVTLPFLPWFATAHPLADWSILAGLGLTGLVGQMLLTASLRHGAVVSVLVVDYVSLLWATLLGWALWNQFPHAATWLGAPLIVGAGLIIVWRERVLHRAAAALAAPNAVE